MAVHDGEIVLRGGEVIDGSGAPRFAADVVITGDRISAVVRPGLAAGGSVVDIRGRVVCPGFIDTHTHDDRLVLEGSDPHPKLSQGVCTVVTGNCGISLAPLACEDPPPPLDIFGRSSHRFERFADYLVALDAGCPSVNVVPLIGHTSLRVKHVRDLQRSATAPETLAMRHELREALDDGAFGFSTGVYYPPARAATTGELLDLCSELAGRRSLLAMHVRDEGDGVMEALEEALLVGARAGATLVISHHKVVGASNHGRTLETLRLIDRATATQDVCLDCYPYDASSTMLDPQKAARTGDVLITWSGTQPEMGGRTLRSVAEEWSLGLEEAAQRLMPGGAIYFSMAEDDVARVLQYHGTMIGSDGLPHDLRPHPRLWGAFPRVLGRFGRDRRLFTLEAAVHKMTGLPARRFGLHGRGRLEVGAVADLVVVDPETVGDASTYEDPTRLSVGIGPVFVNGRIAWQDGAMRDAHAGRRLLPTAR